MDTQTVSRLGLTVAGFAEATTLHPQTVRQLLRDGRIRSVRVGRRHVIPRTELERFLSVEPQSAETAGAPGGGERREDGGGPMSPAEIRKTGEHRETARKVAAPLLEPDADDLGLP